MNDKLEKLREEWLRQYKTALKCKLLDLCNSERLNTGMIIIGKSLECDIRPVVVECLDELAEEFRKNNISLNKCSTQSRSFRSE